MHDDHVSGDVVNAAVVKADFARPSDVVDPQVWTGRHIRLAWAQRDLKTVFTHLQRRGLSQRTIASLTGMAQSEVYEILRGRRVQAYDVLLRVCQGLGVPRGWAGLAHDPATSALTTDHAHHDAATTPQAAADALLALASTLTTAVAPAISTVTNSNGYEWQLPQAGPAPLPAVVTDSDVAQIEAVTATFRSLDYRHGGGAIRPALTAHATWVLSLAEHTTCREPARVRLHTAVADLVNLAGWACLDTGLYSDARGYFAHALRHARAAGEPSLTANVLYRAARLQLHTDLTGHALRFLQLAQIPATDSGCDRTQAMLHANRAWAHALTGQITPALASLRQAADHLDRVQPTTPTSGPWVSFFHPSDLHALTGMTHLALAQHRPGPSTPRPPSPP